MVDAEGWKEKDIFPSVSPLVVLPIVPSMLSSISSLVVMVDSGFSGLTLRGLSSSALWGSTFAPWHRSSLVVSMHLKKGGEWIGGKRQEGLDRRKRERDWRD